MYLDTCIGDTCIDIDLTSLYSIVHRYRFTPYLKYRVSVSIFWKNWVSRPSLAVTHNPVAIVRTHKQTNILKSLTQRLLLIKKFW